jgi:hypothetical protein
VDCPLPSRWNADPHVWFVHPPSGSEYAAGRASTRPRRDSDDAVHQFEEEAEAALGLPTGVHSYALLPIGYPMGRFGPVRRVPLADVVYEDRWGQPCRDL